MANLQSTFAISQLLGGPSALPPPPPPPQATCWSFPPLAVANAALDTRAGFAFPVRAAGAFGDPAGVSAIAASGASPEAHSERLAADASSALAQAGRSPRIPFTRHQLLALEARFTLQHYLSGSDAGALSSTLGLSVSKVLQLF